MEEYSYLSLLERSLFCLGSGRGSCHNTILGMLGAVLWFICQCKLIEASVEGRGSDKKGVILHRLRNVKP